MLNMVCFGTGTFKATVCLLKRKSFVLLVAVLMTTSVTLSAQDLTTLIPESATAAVTQAEVDLFDTYYPSHEIPLNNDEKKMTWDLSPFIHSLIFMYEITGDKKYIDHAILCCDIILAAKRIHDIDYVTQRKIPGWAYFYEQFNDNEGNPAMYNNVVGNGCIIRALTRVARVIRRDNLEEATQLKAQTYIQSCTETINDFIGHTEWFDAGTNLFHFPDNERHDDCLPNSGGLISAHNRQLIMVAGMLNVVKYHELKGDEAALRSTYIPIIESVANYFWNSVTTHSSGDSTYYLWNYREEKKDGKDPKVEDIAHGGLDIQCIVQIHDDLGIGTETQLSYIGNTLMEHTQFDPENHSFSDRIDGSGIDEDPKTENNKSIRWLGLSDWDRRVFTNAGWQLTNDVKLKKSLPYCEFLFYKAKYFGTNFTGLSNSDIRIPETTEITVFPNPSSDLIHIVFPNNQSELVNLSVFKLATGKLYITTTIEPQVKNDSNMQLDISLLPIGIYILVIQTNTTRISKKIIKT
tara:strand:- start:252 stop:1814 length:1563 start_codon:yes stop_codon:yes gene_type:complete